MKYVEFKGITKDFFYKETGVSASNFKGKGIESELGGDKIAKILSLYYDLNAEWLLTGKGSMLKETADVERSSIKNSGLVGGDIINLDRASSYMGATSSSQANDSDNKRIQALQNEIEELKKTLKTQKQEAKKQEAIIKGLQDEIIKSKDHIIQLLTNSK